MRVQLPHLLHRDSSWQVRGIHAYYQCRCGARRVKRVVTNLAGPIDAGWPRLLDAHGRPTTDSGWQ